MMKVIRTMREYEKALAEIEALMDLNPSIGSAERDKLDLLAILVEDFESRTLPVAIPNPIDAIRFRMEQKSLSQRDLIPFIGSRSKVSEVLSRKRPLTLSMIRALYTGLGIPAEILLQGQNPSILREYAIEWNKFPLREMISRGWIEEEISQGDEAETILRRFFAPLGEMSEVEALCRSSDHVRSGRSMNIYALTAWAAQVIIRAFNEPTPGEYRRGSLNFDFLKIIARISSNDDGPRLVKEFLGEHGISLIIEPHLSQTYLDGAAIVIKRKKPIIGLTLRYDRIDNFWYTLMHELAHISLHFDECVNLFYDDLDVDSQEDPLEQQADALTSEVLIPAREWEKSAASKLRSPDAAQTLAKKLGIHPAIVAGRMRHAFRAYRLLTNLVGHGQIRRQFPEINWDK